MPPRHKETERSFTIWQILSAFLALTATAFAQQAAQPSLTDRAKDAAGNALKNIVTPAASPSTSPKAARVNINKASASELDALPQIGEARAKAIITGRPYKSIDELKTRKILPENASSAIADKITVN